MTEQEHTPTPCKHSLVPELITSSDLAGNKWHWLECAHVLEPCSGPHWETAFDAGKAWNEHAQLKADNETLMEASNFEANRSVQLETYRDKAVDDVKALRDALAGSYDVTERGNEGDIALISDIDARYPDIGIAITAPEKPGN